MFAAAFGRSGAVAYLGRTDRILNLGLTHPTLRTMNCSAHSFTKGRSLDHRRPDGLGKGLGQLGSLASNDGAMPRNGVDVLDDLIEFRNLAIGYDDGAFKLFEDRTALRRLL